MKYYCDTTQKWKLSTIREFADNDTLVVLPHQRLEKSKNKRKGPAELVKAVLADELETPWVYSDLQSNYEYAKFRGDIEATKIF